MKILRLETCQIKRKKDSPWETMVNVNEGSGPLIDMNGKVVKGPIYSVRELHEQVMTVKEEG